MDKRRCSVRIVASALILVFPLATAPLSAGETASISGQLVGATNFVPLAGAKLHVEDTAKGISFVSGLTGVDGRFDLDSLPSSSYRLSVESNHGLYVVDTPLHLNSGQARHLRLAVGGDSPRRGGTGRASGSKGMSGGTFWSNPLTATLIVVGAAIVVGVVVNSATNNQAPASASLP
jgi:hypothetical protein